MRIAELSRTSSASSATIKYYIREGLLPPGQLTSSNQARYTADHVHRLRLIRALLDLGGLTISRVREIVAALDGPADESVLRAMTAQVAASGPHNAANLLADPLTTAEVQSLAERRGWTIPADSPAFAAVVDVLETLRELGHEHVAERLDAYAEAAERAAAVDREALRSCVGPERRAESLIVGNLLGDHLLAALRRLAQEDRTDAPGRTLAA
ncbi:MerR family transcriptional regulator [Streptomyces sp. NPDC101158]|uniref:MerR family transcriptional regulator n=1 Tax=Streptomyces sp. NPDC101158 TaxID=3366117 RepID=UPI0038292CD2